MPGLRLFVSGIIVALLGYLGTFSRSGFVIKQKMTPSLREMF